MAPKALQDKNLNGYLYFQSIHLTHRVLFEYFTALLGLHLLERSLTEMTFWFEYPAPRLNLGTAGWEA